MLLKCKIKLFLFFAFCFAYGSLFAVYNGQFHILTLYDLMVSQYLPFQFY
jgi:hypothetical protein